MLQSSGQGWVDAVALGVVTILISCVGHGNLLAFGGDEAVAAFYHLRVRSKLGQTSVRLSLFIYNFIDRFRISFSNKDHKITTSTINNIVFNRMAKIMVKLSVSPIIQSNDNKCF